MRSARFSSTICCRVSTHWRDLFDLVLVRSKKPEFFKSRRPFIELSDSGSEVESAQVPAWGRVYQHGSLEGLMQLIGEPGERVLYVGDHIYGDIVSSKLESTWRTALIVRELEEEIARRKDLSDQIRHGRDLKHRLTDLGHDMDHLRDVVATPSPPSRAGRCDPCARPARPSGTPWRPIVSQHQQVLGEQAKWADRLERQFNPYWGSFFKQGVSKTRFSGQLETYACLYTSRVSNFSYYGTNRYFRVTRDPMMHEWVDSDPD